MKFYLSFNSAYIFDLIHLEAVHKTVADSNLLNLAFFSSDLSNDCKLARKKYEMFLSMDRSKAKSLAKDLNELACKGCTEGWLEKHDGLTDPIQDIKDCGTHGFISPERQERLVNEVNQINAQN